MDNIKSYILNAIQEGNYQVKIEEPNNVICCKKYDGTVFYKLREDDVKFGCHPGYCYVEFDEYQFTCDLETGEWTLDDEIVDDEEIIAAIKSIDGVIYGEHYDGFSYLEIYYAANPDAEEGELYCDDESPVDIDELGWNDAYIEVKYKVSESDGAKTQGLECTICDQKLYDLYVHLHDHEDFDKGVILSHTDIKEFDEELYNEIMEQIKDDINEGANQNNISFQISISAYTIESQLG